MGKVETLRPASARSPERAALAAAIAAAGEAHRAAEAARAAVTRAREIVDAAAAKVNDAAADVAAARDRHAQRIAAAATAGSALAQDRTVRAARLNEVDAQDDLAAATAALSTVEAALAEAEDALRRAGQRVEAAAVTVMAAELPRLLADAQAVQADLLRRREALAHLSRLLWRPGILQLPDDDPLHALDRFLHDDVLRSGTAGAEPWQAAREALLRDPDAALPAA